MTPTLLWHHGSPQTGAVLPPVAAVADELGLEVVSFARPAYGGAPRMPGRTCADVVAGIRAALDERGIGEVVSVGASGGGPHALACAALMPDRVRAVVTFASIAPYTGDESWFAGMASPGGLRAAVRGEAARAAFAETDAFDPASFTDADYATLAGAWSALGEDAQRAEREGPWGLIDDDLAFTRPWGFGFADVQASVHLYQGGDDRVVPPHHAEALQAAFPRARLVCVPGAGHISILEHLTDGIRAAL
ncbi:alpha/beta fold hydrolase [Haliangium ochraceum]|uniref:Alpha/beta hydrolase fold protein n=1 Tax=Haliangium ochraceum (strain DSM 14365 / JCM 11303 / SMP-2) TaxID=502025 RepID=D0LRZ6_HALO1|nr:alpha/beta fold hydrolase [Haliangium ochraceum]ACY13693.1 alpha/beta hydrolase fold protein [Haliangium ochraceum DSM 14365]